MKTEQKIIKNLKNKIAERKLQVNDLYAEYAYKMAIKQIVTEKLGTDPNRVDYNNLPYVG